MNELDEWMDRHEARLGDIAQETGLPVGVVHLAAVLVLSGLDDDEIYPHLGDHMLSMDGKHDPLAGAARALEEIRQLVDVSSPGDPGAW